MAAVIFDLDGVIVDSEIWWHEERVAWAAARGLRWTEADTRAVMGANSAAWARIMRQRLGMAESDEPAILEAVVDRVTARYAGGAPVIEGAVEAVRRIAAVWPVAIASSAHRGVIDAALDATGLRATIPVVVSSDEVDHGKPAPDVYLEAARRLGVAAAGCLIVEDSINGLRAGLAAGMTTVLVPNPSVPPAPGAEAIADHVLARLVDLDPAALALRAGAAEPANGAA
ncbi:MAG: HAD family phosphatase [Chloroflexota bacterium]|nr:MAG: HAD family phosphatase [Chloroflexota bacterium]